MGYCYRLPGCGCVVAATLDGDTPAQKREVTRFKRDPKLQGFTLDHLPAEEIRSLPWGWPCEHMKAGAVDAA
jgi:hypothetical protein